jgi:anti-sigma B factor antagonist
VRSTFRQEIHGRGATATTGVSHRKGIAMMQTEADFEISGDTGDGVVVLAVRGEIDVATAPRLREQLTTVAGSGAQLCVVDMSAVTFVDSTALGVLVSAAQACREAGGEFRLVATEPHVRKVFTITGLDDVFAIYAGTDEALARR